MGRLTPLIRRQVVPLPNHFTSWIHAHFDLLRLIGMQFSTHAPHRFILRRGRDGLPAWNCWPVAALLAMPLFPMTRAFTTNSQGLVAHGFPPIPLGIRMVVMSSASSG